MMCRNIGRRKANVFPLPVLAIPIKSRPERENKVMLIKHSKHKKLQQLTSFVVHEDLKVETL
jgi:hypothetical protein